VKPQFRASVRPGGILLVSEIVEENGRTIRENNLARSHSIPIGALVEVKYDRWFGCGACEKVHARLWVAKHTRDCDGTPLYVLGRDRDPDLDLETGCFREEYLRPIEVTPELVNGYDALEWNEEGL
jgi:hypothetical protein